ncbi:hypothetical protein CAPTEDRAFT_202759 [Capitella teleta]|uniref:Uncharacterized protein n=1 Tax=Capitella teleta TaxID=283909 RepID=R7TWG6_CAPTE|nr:hypothetical protein CAPTEDRAFT_202759 [Capitella teleta]|eukprot:ELT95300.1 hypothetical protein CAPTEDRAFT_202759 [Capitella teleta]
MAASVEFVNWAIRAVCLASICTAVLLCLWFNPEDAPAPRLAEGRNPYSLHPGFTTQIDLQRNNSSKILDRVDDYEFFRYPYMHKNITEYGKRLPVSKWLLKKYQMRIKYLERLDAESVHQFVFVMACSADHFEESLDALATVQEQFPTHRVMYYDWGLDPWQIEKLETLCQVTYVPFNISSYPASKAQSGNAKFQAAKIFCIMDALVNNPGVFWIDAATRFFNSSGFTILYQKVIRNGGFALISKSANSAFAVTHPGMYEYLPTDIELQKKFGMSESGAILMYKTQKVFDNIIWWWFLCSLSADCITPTVDLDCKFSKDIMRTFAHCHRVDQSA